MMVGYPRRPTSSKRVMFSVADGLNGLPLEVNGLPTRPTLSRWKKRVSVISG